MSPENSEQPKEPLFHAPFQQPETPPAQQPPTVEPATPKVGGGPDKSKLPLIIGIAAILELLVIITLVIVVAGKSGSSNTNQQKANNSNTSQAQGPTAATPSSVQLTDDSISQDLSSLNDDKDFPQDKFSDQSLHL